MIDFLSSWIQDFAYGSCYLRTLLTNFPDVTISLLHAGYTFHLPISCCWDRMLIMLWSDSLITNKLEKKKKKRNSL